VEFWAKLIRLPNLVGVYAFSFSILNRHSSAWRKCHQCPGLNTEHPSHMATRESDMKQSDHFRENAENCAQLAERSTDGPTYKRYKRMEASWRALAEEQDWLDGEKP